MTVKELIIKLQNMNQELPVVVEDFDTCEIIDVKIVKEHVAQSNEYEPVKGNNTMKVCYIGG